MAAMALKVNTGKHLKDEVATIEYMKRVKSLHIYSKNGAIVFLISNIAMMSHLRRLPLLSS